MLLGLDLFVLHSVTTPQGAVLADPTGFFDLSMTRSPRVPRAVPVVRRFERGRISYLRAAGKYTKRVTVPTNFMRTRVRISHSCRSPRMAAENPATPAGRSYFLAPLCDASRFSTTPSCLSFAPYVAQSPRCCAATASR